MSMYFTCLCQYCYKLYVTTYAMRCMSCANKLIYILEKWTQGQYFKQVQFIIVPFFD